MAVVRRYPESLDHSPGKYQATKGCGDVDSTAIASIGYDDNGQRLFVTFNSGRSYAYYQVSRQRYQAFCSADSKGRYFNSGIRNRYAYRRIG